MNDLLKKDKELIWHPFTPQNEDTPAPIFISKAEGVYLYTSDNRKIIDAISSWWVNLHGHSNPLIAKAIYEQATILEHVIFAGFTHEPAIQLAENLKKILPPSMSKIFFSDNGSTANEVAIKMAIQYWHNKGIKKRRIIALEGAYHGDTFGSMSVGDRSVFTAPFNDYLFEVSFLDLPTEENERSIISAFTEMVGTGDIGVFIFEPLIQGAAGMRMYSPETLEKLLQIAKANQVICIADEVFTGFCRTGKFFATDYLITKPDIMAVSKGITGGTLPLGVTTCSAEIYEAYKSADITKTFLHGHSYTANPLSCAAANASYSILMSTDCQRQIEKITTLHSTFVEKLKSHTLVKKVSSLGTILSVEIKTSNKTEYTNSLRKLIYEYFLEKDILLRPLGNILYIVPPYCIREDELQIIYQAIEDFLLLLENRKP
jgi:adenosylmethionine-8-amino-7-oxononanoate aminotransferase